MQHKLCKTYYLWSSYSLTSLSVSLSNSWSCNKIVLTRCGYYSLHTQTDVTANRSSYAHTSRVGRVNHARAIGLLSQRDTTRPIGL